MKRDALAVDFIFVSGRDRVNSQTGVYIVNDNYLARLPYAMMSHVGPGLSQL